jgi:hypothetical protein
MPVESEELIGFYANFSIHSRIFSASSIAIIELLLIPETRLNDLLARTSDTVEDGLEISASLIYLADSIMEEDGTIFMTEMEHRFQYWWHDRVADGSIYLIFWLLTTNWENGRIINPDRHHLVTRLLRMLKTFNLEFVNGFNSSLTQILISGTGRQSEPFWHPSGLQNEVHNIYRGIGSSTER